MRRQTKDVIFVLAPSVGQERFFCITMQTHQWEDAFTNRSYGSLVFENIQAFLCECASIDEENCSIGLFYGKLAPEDIVRCIDFSDLFRSTNPRSYAAR